MTDTSYLYKYFLEKSPKQEKVLKNSKAKDTEKENVRKTQKEDKENE